jgi:hypothetical protein
MAATDEEVLGLCNAVSAAKADVAAAQSTFDAETVAYQAQYGAWVALREPLNAAEGVLAAAKAALDAALAGRA